MRIATWNVNSLKARMDKVEWWLGRAEPDVLLIQETKLTDQDAPVMPFQMWGYELLHHGEGRWNGVAIASRVGIGGEGVPNFEAERAAFRRLLEWGLADTYRSNRSEPGRFTWWDYRAGNFHKNLGMRIDHLLATPQVAKRVIWAEIDREARKGTPIPSDHAPLLIDLDEPGVPIDAGWEAAAARIAARGGTRVR